MKTVATRKSVEKFLRSVDDPQRREDCEVLLRIMQRVSGKKPVIWGDSIVGFDSYRYKRADGKEFEFFRTGFSPRKTALTVYIMPGYTDYSDILKDLGPHKLGRSCLYIKRLSDVDLAVLERLIEAGLEDMSRSYPG
jgi:hypothetical protein